MATVRPFTSSFGGGEVTSELFGRIDDAKFRSGVALMRNFIALPHGPAMNRPGFKFVRAAKYDDLSARLIPFVYNSTQTLAIEMGAGYFRFHTQGGTVLSGGVPYEIANPYTSPEIFDIHYVQSGDVITLVHPTWAPRELRRNGATDWVLSTIAFASSLSPPSSVAAVATTNGASGLVTYEYVVTAVDASGTQESAASTVGSCSNNLLHAGAYNTVDCTAVSGAARYNVYRRYAGVYAYIGTTDNTVLVDENLTPDVSRTPPVESNPFSEPGLYPAAVSYYEQRRVFAGTVNLPQNLWMTRSGTESSMSVSFPVRDDDRIAIRIAAREASAIRHAVPLQSLLLLTASGEWRVDSGSNEAIAPSRISVRPQSYVGASGVQPIVVNNSLIFCAARGGHVREMGFNQDAGGFVTGDLSLRAPHLFDNLNIVDMAFEKAPHPIVWCVSTSGKLLGFTYVPEQQVGAWHQHDTDGAFESICSVGEGNEDVLYAIVRRVVNGVTKRYVECMASRAYTDVTGAFFVDSGLTYDGGATSTITGLSHLEGKTVAILADGAVMAPKVVVGGTITLDEPASRVHVGLPITADLQTLPAVMQVDAAFGQGRFKNVNKVWLRVVHSSGIFAGPTLDRLREAKVRTTEMPGAPPALRTDTLEITVDPDWQQDGSLFIRQVDPLPLTVVGLTLEVALGG